MDLLFGFSSSERELATFVMVSHFLRIAGVDKVEVDAAKGTLTVTGNADPCEIIVCIRKAGKCAEVVSIGPPPEPDKKTRSPTRRSRIKRSPTRRSRIKRSPVCLTTVLCVR
jgi:hypothetical protein